MKLSAFLMPDLKNENKKKNETLLCFLKFVILCQMCWNCRSSLWWKIRVRLLMLESKWKGLKKVWSGLTKREVCIPPSLIPSFEPFHHVPPDCHPQLNHTLVFYRILSCFLIEMFLATPQIRVCRLLFSQGLYLSSLLTYWRVFTTA